MIRAITFVNRFGRALRCVLGDPERTQFAITEIKGLGPEKASVNIHAISTADGGYFGSARFESRNIVITFCLLDLLKNGKYYSVEDARHLSYEFFAPKSKMRIVVESDTRTVMIEGYVESNEPEIFQQNVILTVSILCPDYYFKMVTENGSKKIESIYGNGLFEFPFWNPVSTKKLEFGIVSASQDYDMLYEGDAENGFEMHVMFTGETVNRFKITNEPLGNFEKGPIGFDRASDARREIYNWKDDDIYASYIEIYLSDVVTKLTGRYSGQIFASGNEIIIRSILGKKSVIFRTIGGTDYNIIDAVRHLSWLKLYPGYNQLTVNTDNASIGHFNVSIEYEALYTGV